MKKSLLLTFGICAAVFGVSCNKQSTPVERLDINCSELASCIGTDFDAFVKANEKYQDEIDAEEGTVSFNAVLKISESTYDMELTVNSDKHGMIISFDASLEDETKSRELWDYFMGHTDDLKLGAFFGTKFNGKIGGGLKQTIEETISLVAEKGTDDSVVCPIFNFAPERVYLVPGLYDEEFVLSILRSWYDLDYADASAMIGADCNTFASQNYILGNKLSAWGTNYIYFDYVKDPAGNIFHMDVNADTDFKNITGMKATLNYEYYNDKDKELAIWKSYASGDAALGLGTFSKAYTASFGAAQGEFKSQQDAIDYVEKNGRPGGFDPDIVVCYENGGHTITVTLKSLYMYVEVK